MSANEEDRTKSQPGQNPGQSLSPYQQGQQRFDQPMPSHPLPQGFGGAGGYGSEGRYSSGPMSLRGNVRQQDDLPMGYSPYGQGDPDQQAVTAGWGGQGQPQRHPDPHYHAWRARQNRQFDEDWVAFNRERQTSFDDAFDRWRKSRAEKADALAANDAESAVSSAPDAITAKDQ